MPQVLDGRDLGEEAVAADVEAPALGLGGAADAADHRVGLEHGGDHVGLGQLVGGGEARRARTDDDDPRCGGGIGRERAGVGPTGGGVWRAGVFRGHGALSRLEGGAGRGRDSGRQEGQDDDLQSRRSLVTGPSTGGPPTAVGDPVAQRPKGRPLGSESVSETASPLSRAPSDGMPRAGAIGAGRDRGGGAGRGGGGHRAALRDPVPAVAGRGPLGQHRPAAAGPDPGRPAPRRAPAAVLLPAARLDAGVRHRGRRRAGPVRPVRGDHAARRLAGGPAAGRTAARLAVRRRAGPVALRPALRHRDPHVLADRAAGAGGLPGARRRRPARPARVGPPGGAGRDLGPAAAHPLLVDVAGRRGGAGPAVALAAGGPSRRRTAAGRAALALAAGRRAVPAVAAVVPLPGRPHRHAVGRLAATHLRASPPPCATSGAATSATPNWSAACC